MDTVQWNPSYLWDSPLYWRSGGNCISVLPSLSHLTWADYLGTRVSQSGKLFCLIILLSYYLIILPIISLFIYKIKSLQNVFHKVTKIRVILSKTVIDETNNVRADL